MKSRILLGLTIFFFFISCISAQMKINNFNSSSDSNQVTIELYFSPESASDNNLKWYTMFTKVPRDIGNFPASALNSDKLPLIAALAAGTGALMLLDEQGWQANRRLFNESNTFHSLSDFGVALGNEKYHFIVVGMFGAWGLINHDSRSLKTASNIVEAVIASGVSVQILKRIFGRESPAAATEAAGEWTLFPNLKEYQKHQPKYYAYPSGHITTLTAAITVLANNYPEAKWIKPVGYSLIAICGVGLVSRGMHWYSDLPAGFFLGYTFGNLISPEQEVPSASESSLSSVHFSPLIGANNLGVQFSFNF
jgi:membrane-associated phospholipid phosphatase